jgi:hypothetical protein
MAKIILLVVVSSKQYLRRGIEKRMTKRGKEKVSERERGSHRERKRMTKRRK